jgi:7-cyano-7-deazaguanine synthase
MSSNSKRDKPGAVVLLSGGMDSCVCAALAARNYEASALHVMYGQRTEDREHQAFQEICDRLEIERRLVVRNEALTAIGGSALTDTKLEVPQAKGFEGRSPQLPGTGEVAASLSSASSGIPITYVPFRNAHFLAVAVSWAEVIGAAKILIGAVEQDSSGYPDCRPEYYRAFNEVIRTGTREGQIEIVTPLIGLRKSEIVRLGLELKAPLELTWSCYSREDRACGTCESCQLRQRAFEAAGSVDPVSDFPPVARS